MNYQYSFQRSLGENIVLVRLLNKKIAEVSELSNLRALIQEKIDSTAPIVFVESNKNSGIAYNTIDRIAANLQAQNLNMDEIFKNAPINTL